VITPKVAALTEGVLKAMLLTKLKTGTAVLLVAVAGLIGPLLFVYGSEKPADAPKQAQIDERHPSVPFTLKVGERYMFVTPTSKGFFHNFTGEDLIVLERPSNNWVKVKAGSDGLEGWLNLNHIMTVVPLGKDPEKSK